MNKYEAPNISITLIDCGKACIIFPNPKTTISVCTIKPEQRPRLKNIPFLLPFPRLVLIMNIISGPGKSVNVIEETRKRKIIFCSIKGKFINIFALQYNAFEDD